jgi:AraC-like DNA-binding protein
MNRNGTKQPYEEEEIMLSRKALAERIREQTAGGNGPRKSIPELGLYKWETPSTPTCYLHEPSVCLLAQGAKSVLLGGEIYSYDANHYLVTSVDLPVVAQITEASKEKPYLGLTFRLDQREIARLMVDGKLPPPRKAQVDRGMVVSEVSLPLLHAFRRLLDLLDKPEDIPVLGPLIQKEILYRLLVDDQGYRLSQIGASGSRGHQVARAIDWLKNNYASPFHVDDLAAQAHMSTSSFHSHFRTMTSMSPLQYQKWLRLHEARRLMFAEHLDAATASFKVGYESPSQFSREYSRLFGAPPLRDIRSLHRASPALARQN